MLDAGELDASTDDDYDDLTKVKVCANKVGVYHRLRYGGGKTLSKKPLVNVGSVVRKGQPLGFIEQMGAVTAIEVCAHQAHAGTAAWRSCRIDARLRRQTE